MIIITNYVIPIGNPCKGFGVLAGNFFITAGHVINDGADYEFNFKGKKYKLDKEHLVYFSALGDGEGYVNGNDIALFKFDGINSPIQLTTRSPLKGDSLTSVSMCYKTTTDSNENIPEIFRLSTTLVPIECQGEVIDTEGNYFLCEMSYPLRKGSSGSPIFFGDKLVGILHGGDKDKDTCCFQSTASFVDKL